MIPPTATRAARTEKNKRKREGKKQRKAEEKAKAAEEERLLAPPAAPADSSPSTSPSTTPIFEIKATGAKGLGVLILQSVPKGTEIMREDYLVKSNLAIICCEATVNTLSNEKRERLLALDHTCHCGKNPCPQSTIERIWQSNGLNKPGDTTHLMIYENASRINHACIPNADHEITEEGHLVVYATRDIEAGEEITRNYLSVRGRACNRREQIAAEGHFHCECETCIDDETTAPESLITVSNLRKVGPVTQLLNKNTAIEKHKNLAISAWYQEIKAQGDRIKDKLINWAVRCYFDGTSDKERRNENFKIASEYKEVLDKENKYGLSKEVLDKHRLEVGKVLMNFAEEKYVFAKECREKLQPGVFEAVIKAMEAKLKIDGNKDGL